MATENQKKVFERVAEKVRKGTKVSISNEMKGIYSKWMTTKPDKLTKSRGWRELMDRYLPEDKLAKVHSEGLSATKQEHKIVGRDEDGKPVYEFVKVPDFSARHKYLDTGYKLYKKYEDGNGVSNNTFNLIQILQQVDERRRNGNGLATESD